MMEQHDKPKLYVLGIIIIALLIITTGALVYVYFELFGPKPSTPIDPTNTYIVTPQPESTFFNSTFLNNTIPSSMVHGQKYDVTIISLNTGDAPWTNSTTVLIPIDNNSSDTKLFGSISTMEPGKIIKNGSQYIWKFSITAPQGNGNYSLEYRLTNNTTLFGDTLVKNVEVGLPGDEVAFTLVDVPYSMKTNSQINLTFIVENMGRDTWFENDSVQLGITYDPNDGSPFTRTARLHMNPDSAVFTGQSCKWKFLITAPPYLTKYNMSIRMIHDQEWFGNPVNRTVIITS